MSSMEPLLDAYREKLGEGPEPSAAQRAAVLDAAPAKPRPRRWVPALAGGLGVASAGVLLALALRPAGPDPLTCSSDGVALEAGAWVGAPEPKTLAFSDASEIALTPGSRLRLDAMDEARVQLTLEAGRVAAHVEPGGPRRWSLQAGPYEVRVVGTDFDVDWRGAEGAVVVAVRHGVVRVGRRDRTPEGTQVEVQAGETLRMDAAGHTLRTADEASTEAAAEPAEETSEAEVPARLAPARRATRRPPPRPDREAPSDWRRLASEGHYAEAARVARARGLPALRERLDAAGLLQLADVSRLGGAPAEARQTLAALESRFPRSREARAALFRRGRMAADAGNHAAAIAHFDRYVAAGPGGPRAAQAEGRALESAARLGRPTETRARRYLARHPEGPYRALAERLLAE